MKNLLLFSAFLSVLLVGSCQNRSETIPSLTLVWETDTIMTTSESALYDPTSGLIYVSNINKGPWELDYNGFISRLSIQGEIIDQVWFADSISGPKGMGISNGNLYINDINKIVEVNLSNQKMSNSYPLANNAALNDITVNKKGQVFSSNSATSEIFTIKDKRLEKVVSLDSTARLNGLYASHDRLYFACSNSNSFGFYDTNNKNIQIITDRVAWADGIVQLDNGNFITSSWDGQLFYISSKDGKSTQILDLREQKINAADIDYIPEEQLIIVPTFFHNTVRAYKLNY